MEEKHHHHEHCCSCEHEHHHHEHHHEHEEGGLKESLIKIGAAGILLIASVVIEHTFDLKTWQLLLIYLVPYLIVGYETLHEAIENIFNGEVFDEDFLMCVATLGALAIGFLPGAEHQFPEAVFVMLFFQVGEMFEGIAEGRSRKSISELMDIRPDTANVERDGKVITVNPNDVKVGEIIVIRPGEKVPMDGLVIEGDSNLDTVALTGESVPRSIHPEDNVISGCVNLSGVLRVKVEKAFGESTAAKVLELVENASDHKSRSENFITRFAKVYTPIVVYLALALAFIPPFFCGVSYVEALPTWLYRALTFLVVSCPCALVISVPLTFFGGIGGASKRGILVKGSNYLETLAHLSTVVFDKTGTLTKGIFAVQVVHPQEISETELLHMAAHVERFSNHPIAISLRDAYPNEATCECNVEDVEETSGYGVKAKVNGKVVCVGNEKMMNQAGADLSVLEGHACGHVGTTIHVSIDGHYAGHIVIADKIKDDAHEAVRALYNIGVKKTVMLTGDHKSVAAHVAGKVGIDTYYAELLPQNKVSIMERILDREARHSKAATAFVGDGINDAPVLARADVGIAMGGLGSDAAIEAADVVIMDDKPSKIATGIAIAKHTLTIARENVWFSIGIKVAVLILAAIGLASMWLAVFADVGVCVLAVLNAMRALRVRA